MDNLVPVNMFYETVESRTVYSKCINLFFELKRVFNGSSPGLDAVVFFGSFPLDLRLDICVSGDFLSDHMVPKFEINLKNIESRL